MSKTPEAKEPVVRQLIPTGLVTEFGEFLDDPEASMIAGQDQVDFTYTPGWSELRHQRDADVGEGKQAAPLPGNLRLVRRTQVNGTPDQFKTVQSTNKGYRAVTNADVGQDWFKALPAGATVLPDGSIGKGDCVYMWADQNTAARNSLLKQKRTLERQGKTLDSLKDKGIEKTVKLGTPIKVGRAPA